MSDTPGTNITLVGDWSKPATVLIEKISNALGGYFEPHQIKRIADAKAGAAKIEAAANIEITELQQRALRRFVAEEMKQQDNMESIAMKALPHISDQAKTENVDDDWITNFFDKCRIIFDEQMQSLWSKVLAGEANAPGSFSKRTVNYLASLDTKDASLITSLYGFCWMFEGLTPLIFNVEHSIYNSHGITFDSLEHLESIGLVSFDPLAGYAKKGLPPQFTVHYYGTQIEIQLHHDMKAQYHFDLGMVC